MLNGYEIMLLLALALIFFGAKKLPELARGLGQGIREFKKASREATSEFESMVETEAPNSHRVSPPKEAGALAHAAKTEATLPHGS